MKKKETIRKRIWDNRKQILEGIKNKIFQTDSVEEISQIRLNICKGCIKYDDIGTTCLIPGTQPCCGDCGCVLALKTRSLSTGCPLFLWDKILSDKEEIEHDILNSENHD